MSFLEVWNGISLITLGGILLTVSLLLLVGCILAQIIKDKELPISLRLFILSAVLGGVLIMYGGILGVVRIEVNAHRKCISGETSWCDF